MREDVINDDILGVLRNLNDESAQIVIADPPYNIGKDFGNKSDKQPMDEYLRWCDEWIEGVSSGSEKGWNYVHLWI